MTNYGEIMERLFDDIRDLDFELLRYVEELAKIKHTIELLESEGMSRITETKTEEGKPAFPNQQSRDAELRKRCSEHPSWIAMSKEQQEKNTKMEQLKVTRNYYDNKLKSLRALLHYLGGKSEV